MSPNPNTVSEGAPESGLPQLLAPHARVEGANPTSVPGVTAYRTERASPRMQVFYDPCLIIVAQGAKRGYFQGRAFDYNPSSFLACTLPLPFECEILEASPERPFLALGLRISPSEVAELLMRADLPDLPERAAPRVVDSSPLGGDMLDAVVRLIRSFGDPEDARVLGPMARREILYRALTSEQGGAMRAIVQRQGHVRRIGEVMRAIHEDCARPITTAEMMDMAGMSKTVLHESFRAVTDMTPLQFVKSTRLHRARALMLNDGVAASTAAFEVGYASASQFSREFKRLFGHSPSEVGRGG